MPVANDIDNRIGSSLSSQTSTLSWNDTAALIVRLYQITFNRVPDKEGFEHWQRYLNTVEDEQVMPRRLAEVFCQVQEFRDSYGSHRPRDLLATLARNARPGSTEPDETLRAKIDAIANQISETTAPIDLLLAVAQAPEVVSRLSSHIQIFLDGAHKGTETYAGRLFERLPPPPPEEQPEPLPQIADPPSPVPEQPLPVPEPEALSAPPPTVAQPETGQVYRLTLADDSIIGTDFDDVFYARLMPKHAPNERPQHNPTLSDGDTLAGRQGWDELHARIGLKPVRPAILDIEEIRIKAAPVIAGDEPRPSGAHFDASLVSGALAMWNDASSCDLTISGLELNTEVGVRNAIHATTVQYRGQPLFGGAAHLKLSGAVKRLDVPNVRTVEMEVEGGTDADFHASHLADWSISGTGHAWFRVPDETARSLKTINASGFEGDMKLDLREEQSIYFKSGAISNYILFKGNKSNKIITGPGQDWLETFGGADRIDAGSGPNVIFPGTGADTIVISNAANSTLGGDRANFTDVFGFNPREHDTIDFPFLTQRNLVSTELQAKIQKAVDDLGPRATLYDAYDMATDVQGVGKHKVGWFTFGPHPDPNSGRTGPHTYVFVDNDEHTMVRLAGVVRLTADNFAFGLTD
ncbi:hypothetical protein ACFQU1_23520 [Chelatococcus sp. GCM10030263]|uniref:hypothetical protein n=1 Tax=Chelatococcus sp. GCM10030263 TaxID=3273387 RepID=UPI003622D767